MYPGPAADHEIEGRYRPRTEGEAMNDTPLIVVGVAMDTMQQIESHLVMRHYESFLKKGRLRGRR